MMRLFFTVLAAATAAATPAAAWAHSKVVASSPAEGSTVKAPRTVTITFSEALIPPTAGASIVMTAMPGVANHGEMVIRNFTTSWSGDNKTMTLSLRQPLRTGTYQVRWQAAGADGHRMKGAIGFMVS
jgi:copper resistance protein C